MRRCWLSIIGMTLGVSLAGIVVAANPPPLAVPSSAQQVASVQSKQIWNLKNADIRAVIQTIALLTGKNFIIDPRVQGKVTLMSQKPMTPKEMYQVFLSMLQVLNFSAVSSGDVIKIVPIMNAKSEGGRLASQEEPGVGGEMVVRVVPVNQVSAIQLVPVLRPLMPQAATVSAYTPTNALILAGTADNVNRLVAIIRRMDRKSAAGVSVIKLRYANAKHVVSVMNALTSANRAEGKSSNVSLAADVDNNSILVSANLANRTNMRRLIRQLDTRANENNTKVIHLNYLDAKKLAPILSKIAHGAIAAKKGETVVSSSSDVSIQAEENDNAIIINAPKNEIRSLTNVVRQLDVRPQQVLVEAIIVDVDENLLNQLGIVWGTSGADGSLLGNGNTFALKLNHGLGFISGSHIQALVHALMSNGATDILSTPSIMVLNNQPALISDGENIGILNRQYSTNTADANNQTVPFNTFERKDVVLSLKVTPNISPNNMLRLKIEQKDDTVAAGGTEDNPIFNTSKITTQVLVHSGDILVLGGLISHNQKKNVQKVPILGYIPLIGRLFTYTTHTIDKKNLMVFIRPIIVNSRLKTRRQTVSRYNYMRLQEIKAQSGQVLTDNSMLPKLTRPDLVRLPVPH